MRIYVLRHYDPDERETSKAEVNNLRIEVHFAYTSAW